MATKPLQFIFKDEVKVEQFGKALAAHVQAPAVIFFRGPLGAGKTTLIRAFLRAKGVTGPIKSPSFAVVESYTLADTVYHHFDFYRLKAPEELEFLGFRDYLETNAIILIEWPERGGALVPAADLELTLAFHGPGRQLDIQAHHAALQSALATVSVEDPS